MPELAPPQRSLKEDLRALAEAPRELWIVLFAKLAESVGLVSLLITVVLWLSHDLGMSDVRAGWWATAFSMTITVCTFFSGFIADAVGIRRALIAAFALSAIARAAMVLARGPGMAVAALILFGAGAAGGIPVMNAALRRYTNPKNRRLGFGIYYLIFNIGGAAAGFVIDWARDLFKGPDGKAQITRILHLPILGDTPMTAWRMVYLVGLGCAIVSFAAALLLREDIDGEAAEGTSPPSAAQAAPWKGPIAIAIEVVREKAFLRYALFVALLALVRMVFTHHQFTFPTYVEREMGQDFPLFRVTAIEPVLVLVFVSTVTVVTRRLPVFTCIIVGCIISSASVLVLCFGASWTTIVAFLFLIALGEAFWGPRFYEYAAVIAPRGREASYLGLSAAPTFLAKLATTPISGYLLAAYCPKEGERRAWIIWAIIGLAALASSLLMLALRGVIEGRREAAIPEEPESAATTAAE